MKALLTQSLDDDWTTTTKQPNDVPTRRPAQQTDKRTDRAYGPGQMDKPKKTVNTAIPNLEEQNKPKNSINITDRPYSPFGIVQKFPQQRWRTSVLGQLHHQTTEVVFVVLYLCVRCKLALKKSNFSSVQNRAANKESKKKKKEKRLKFTVN